MHLTVDIQLPGEGAAGRELAGQMLTVRMVDLSGREDDMKIEEVYSTALVRSFFFRDRCRSWCWCTVPGCISQSIFAGPSLRFRACDFPGRT